MMTPEQQAAHEAAIDAAREAYERAESSGSHIVFIIEDVITAYQAAMAETVRAAVRALVQPAISYGGFPHHGAEEELNEAERALLDLCGATPGEGE